jgi:hypothetical protein
MGTFSMTLFSAGRGGSSEAVMAAMTTVPEYFSEAMTKPMSAFLLFFFGNNLFDL